MANQNHIQRWLMVLMLALTSIVAGCGGRPAPFGKASVQHGVALAPPADGYRYAGGGEPIVQNRQATMAARDAALTIASISPNRATRGVGVAPVVGAGATGNKELRDAMIRTLMQHGVRLSVKPTPPHVTVEAQVRLGAVRAGSQPAAIEWRVVDANGNLVGTVSQNNQIPATTTTLGWGTSAVGAARAAAPEISRLIAAAR